MDTSSLAIASPPGGIDLEEELIAELIDNFYNSLRWYLFLVLKDIKTPFESLKSILIHAIESVRAIGR